MGTTGNRLPGLGGRFRAARLPADRHALARRDPAAMAGAKAPSWSVIQGVGKVQLSGTKCGNGRRQNR